MAMWILRREDGWDWRDALCARAYTQQIEPMTKLDDELAADYAAAVAAHLNDEGAPPDTDEQAKIAFRIAAEHNLLERVETEADIPQNCDVACAPAEEGE